MLTERELQQRKLVRVPDVVGLPLRKALLLVEQAGLRVGATLYKESYEEKDTTLEQKPQRGQMVYASEEVTLWVSRESYIKWLPAIYQRSDSTGRNVVRDLLWLVQHLFGSIEAQLDNIHLIFDSYETRSEFIPWLAAWSAMMLEPDWPENKKRRLIKKAMELYRWRGTVKGLGLFISLFTGFEPHLQENVWPYQGLRIGVSSTVGIDTVILPPVDKAHAFMVVMPHHFREVTPESIIRLHEIIEMEKPAHSHYMLKFEEPRMAVEEREFYRIGVTSGINIGQEVLTPLPYNPDTGELEMPKEPAMPAPAHEPTVYELFGTRKRQLPPIENAPKADNAPVEGKEIRSSKFGFEGAREFRLDDIMRELLERAGVAVDGVSGSMTTDGSEPGGGGSAAGSAAGSSSGSASSPTSSMSVSVGGGSAANTGFGRSPASVEEMTGTVVGTEDVKGHVKGRGPKVEVDVDLKVVDKEETVTTDDGSSGVETSAKVASAQVEGAGGKPGSGKETMMLAGKTLNELETVRLAPPLSSLQFKEPVKVKTPKVEIDASIETRDREEIERQDKDGSEKPPGNDTKK